MKPNPTAEKWQKEIEDLRARAKTLPYGTERDHLVRQARQLETASQMSEWLASPGLQKPD